MGSSNNIEPHTIGSMRILFAILLTIVSVSIISCSRSSSRNRQLINDAERVMETSSDSALTMLTHIESPELLPDSLRAKYYYVKGYSNVGCNNSLVGDSLIDFSRDFYRDKSPLRSYRCDIVHIWRQFWIGDTESARRQLDSLSHVPGTPDSIRIIPLRLLALLESSLYSGQPAVDAVLELMAIDQDEYHQMECHYLLVQNYIFANKADSALMWLERMSRFPDGVDAAKYSTYKDLLRGVALGEAGQSQEAIAVFDDILEKTPGNSAEYNARIYKANNLINSGQIALAKKELAIADSLTLNPNPGQPRDLATDMFKKLLETVINYEETGNIKARQMANVSNREQERYNRMTAAQYESEKSAMEFEQRSLALEVENERMTTTIITILIIVLVAVVVIMWYYRNRQRRLIEAEEKAETLGKMVEELKSDNSDKEKLRRAMLQQLGIIKMVAETPTEQNREMLRRFSATGEDSLVNWPDLYSLIDTLHNNFYTRLKDCHGNSLTEKEMQIAVLMIAGFSTKEIAVVTQQSSGTIYVRKTSIRHKLNIPEKEDISAYLNNIK